MDEVFDVLNVMGSGREFTIYLVQKLFRVFTFKVLMTNLFGKPGYE